MKRYHRYVLILTTLIAALGARLAPAGAQTSTPTPQPSPTAVATPGPTATSTAPPGPRALFRRSAAAMKSIHWVHADGQLTGSSPSQQTGLTLHLTGDCNALSFSFTKNQLTGWNVRADFLGRGTSQQSGKTRHINGRFIIIGSTKGARAWERSTRTHNVWKQMKASSSPGYFGSSELVYICLPLMVSYVRPSAYASFTGTRVSSSTFGGAAAWKVIETQKQNTTTATLTTYLDQATLYWLRYAVTQRDSSHPKDRLGLRFDYSKYGQAVSIKPPKVGSSTP